MLVSSYLLSSYTFSGLDALTHLWFSWITSRWICWEKQKKEGHVRWFYNTDEDKRGGATRGWMNQEKNESCWWEEAWVRRDWWEASTHVSEQQGHAAHRHRQTSSTLHPGPRLPATWRSFPTLTRTWTSSPCQKLWEQPQRQSRRRVMLILIRPNWKDCFDPFCLKPLERTWFPNASQLGIKTTIICII